MYLSDSEIRAYKDLLKFEVGLFEVKEIEMGKGIILESITGRKKNFVYDVNASASLKPNDTVWIRIAPVGGMYYAVGSIFFSMPVKIMAGMREAMSSWKNNSFDARQIAEWVTNSGEISDIQKADSSFVFKTYTEIETDFVSVLKRCGMENFFTLETYKEWVTDESNYGLGFVTKALDCLIPDSVHDNDIEYLVKSASEFANNIPRKSLEGKTPNEAILEKKSDNLRKWEFDIFSKEKYMKELESASTHMSKGNFKASYKAFEKVIKDLLGDKVPLFHVFRIYTNAAICCFHWGEGNEMLGEELLNAALRINPMYDFAFRCKEKYVDSNFDFSTLSKSERRVMESIRNNFIATGKRKYQHRVFSKYEKFLKGIGVSLVYTTKTIPTVYKDGEVVNSKIGRNEPCYCGSGKKFKKCCGK